MHGELHLSVLYQLPPRTLRLRDSLVLQLARKELQYALWGFLLGLLVLTAFLPPRCIPAVLLLSDSSSRMISKGKVISVSSTLFGSEAAPQESHYNTVRVTFEYEDNNGHKHVGQSYHFQGRSDRDPSKQPGSPIVVFYSRDYPSAAIANGGRPAPATRPYLTLAVCGMWFLIALGFAWKSLRRGYSDTMAIRCSRAAVGMAARTERSLSGFQGDREYVARIAYRADDGSDRILQLDVDDPLEIMELQSPIILYGSPYSGKGIVLDLVPGVNMLNIDFTGGAVRSVGRMFFLYIAPLGATIGVLAYLANVWITFF